MATSCKQVFPAAVGIVVIFLFVISNSKWKQIHRYPPESTEVQTILKRVDTCLEATNISREFTKVGYDIAARNDAKHFISVLRKIIPKDFSKKYFSPCWETNFSVSIKGSRLVESKVGNITFPSRSQIYRYGGNLNFLKSKGAFNSNVVCLPKVFLIGVAKCGTTFLYCLMTDGLGMHPVQSRKELHWWERWPKSQPNHTPQPENIPVNHLNFGKAYEMIAAGNYGVVTVDGSPNIIDSYNGFYERTPVNLCLLPAIIPEILPDSKFVVTLRNPVTMIYTTFLYTCQGRHMGSNSPDIFHERIVTKLKQFE